MRIRRTKRSLRRERNYYRDAYYSARSENNLHAACHIDGRLAPIDRDGSVPAAKEICEHYWAWVSPAGTSNSARVCQFCHKPDADWLNEIQQAPIDRDELKAVIMSCGPDPAAAEVADAVVAWLGER